MGEPKVKRFNYENEYNGWDTRSQNVYDADDGSNVYYVRDLAADCPEDATISRDLMSAHDWLEVVNYGIELGKQGYDKAELFELRGEGES